MSEPRPERRLNDLGREAVEFVNHFHSFLTPEQKALCGDDLNDAFLSFWMRTRPAILIDFNLEPAQTEKLQTLLSNKGLDTFIYQNSLVVNRVEVFRRISKELEFAKELGWQEGMTLEEWVSQANPGGTVAQRGIIGFFLGFPQSAIKFYMSKSGEKSTGVDITGATGARGVYFATGANLTDAPDVQELKRRIESTSARLGFGSLRSDSDKD